MTTIALIIATIYLIRQIGLFKQSIVKGASNE